jgi:transglutaminase-like putative cysteine protease
VKGLPYCCQLVINEFSSARKPYNGGPTLSPCHLVTLSPCLLVTLSPCQRLLLPRAVAVCLVVTSFIGQGLRAGEPQGKLILDLWEVAYLKAGKAGYVHTTVREFERGPEKVLRTRAELRLTVKRFDDTIQLQMDNGDDETPAGKVVGVFMRQYLGKDKQLLLTGTIKAKQLFVTVDGTRALPPAAWDDAVIGMYAQHRIFQERRIKPGDRFRYASFELSINRLINTQVDVKDHEEVELLGGVRKRLLRVEVRPDRLRDEQGNPIPLPTQTLWLDEKLAPARSQVDVPGLGTMVLFRSTQSGVMQPAPVATLTDIGISQLLPLNRRIARPYETKSALYRITFKGEVDPETAFARGGRQQIKNVQGNTLDLYVRASSGPVPRTDQKIGDEFLQSSYFINRDDAQVRTHARRAAGTETDPWRKALLIEKWVHQNMRTTNDEALATADHVARTLQGDCTEYAMLTAAMCRAEGIPSRTAIGLVYADVENRPVMAFHMWTEVWVQGQWLSLDATLGRGYAGATHLKITDHSWHDTRTVTPLLPVVRVLGKMAIQVVTVDESP